MIKLYISETCPFCRKVMDFFYDNKIDYIKKDVSNAENLDELVKIGGKHQVPFMIDDTVQMYESGDIIEYARSKYVL